MFNKLLLLTLGNNLNGMKKNTFLEWEKRVLVTEKEEAQSLLDSIDSLSVRLQDLTPKETDEVISVGEPERKTFVGTIFTRLKKLVEDIRKKEEPSTDSIFKQLRFVESKEPHLYPDYAYCSKYYCYEVIDDVHFYSSSSDSLNYDYLAEAKNILRKLLRNLEGRIKQVIRNLNALMQDKRAYFRSIVKLLFKNMDDEHSAVNNTTENKQLSYLHLNIRYGTRKFQKIKGSSFRLAIAC